MKKIIFIVFSLIAHLSPGQETGTYQSDSVYKANNIKARLWYMGTNNHLVVTTFYDKEGRLIQYQMDPSIDGAQTTTYYTYNEDGKLISMVDTIKNGDPNKEQLEAFKKMGVDVDKLIKKAKNRPPMEIAKYDLAYAGDQLVKITKYNPNGSIYLVDQLENNGKIKVRSSYRNNKPIKQTTSEYLTKFHKAKFYSWEIREGEKSKWHYSFKYEFENEQVKRFTRYEGNTEMETTEYSYNNKGLLLMIKGSVYERFGYLYY